MALARMGLGEWRGRLGRPERDVGVEPFAVSRNHSFSVLLAVTKRLQQREGLDLRCGTLRRGRRPARQVHLAHADW